MSQPHLELLSHFLQNAKNSSSLGLEGTIDGQTYNPQTGTVHLVVGEGYTDCYDASYSPYEVVGTLLTDKVGHQAGPWGGERAVAIPTRGGWRILITHGQDDEGISDAPGAQQGEEFNLHAKTGTIGAEYTSPPTWDSGWKLTNDGDTPGDGLGGSHFGYQGGLTNLNTMSGHVVSLNDTTQKVSTTTAGGHSQVFNDVLSRITLTTIGGMVDEFDDTTQTIKRTASTNVFSLIDAVNEAITHQASSGVKTILDTSGSVSGVANSISQIGSKISLGALANSGSIVPAITHTDLTSVLTDGSTGIYIQRLQDLRNGIAAILSSMTTSGVPSLPTLGATLTVLWGILGISAPGLPGFAQTPIPSGSSCVSMLP